MTAGTWVNVEMLVPQTGDEAIRSVANFFQRVGYEVMVEKTENGQPQSVHAMDIDCIAGPLANEG